VPRNAGDNGGCGGGGDADVGDGLGIPTARRLMQILVHIRSTPQYDEVMLVHRFLVDSIHNKLPNCIRRLRDVTEFDRNVDLRLKVLKNELDENAWKSTLKRREKTRHTKSEMRDMLTMFNRAAVDIFRASLQQQHLLDEKHTMATVNTLLANLYTLRAYFNECCHAYRERFSIETECISEDKWNWVKIV